MSAACRDHRASGHQTSCYKCRKAEESAARMKIQLEREQAQEAARTALTAEVPMFGWGCVRPGDMMTWSRTDPASRIWTAGTQAAVLEWHPIHARWEHAHRSPFTSHEEALESLSQTGVELVGGDWFED